MKFLKIIITSNLRFSRDTDRGTEPEIEAKMERQGEEGDAKREVYGFEHEK